MAEFVAGRSDASKFERETFSQNLLETWEGRTISSGQFEHLEAFYRKYKRRDEARKDQDKSTPSSLNEGVEIPLVEDDQFSTGH
jgi:hypothetical protein